MGCTYKWLHNVADFKDFANVMLNPDVDVEILSGKGRSYGVEFMLRRDIGKVTGWVSYTYSRSFRTIDGINSGRNTYRMPDYHRLDLAVTFDLNKDIKKRYNHNINISFYNVYCRHNAWMMSF